MAYGCNSADMGEKQAFSEDYAKLLPVFKEQSVMLLLKIWQCRFRFTLSKRLDRLI